jgi:acyl dehydratase
MIDRKFIGYEFKPAERTIARWKISQFANAIRDDNPLYYDSDYAKSQGYKDLPVPPTFFTSIALSDPKFFPTLGIDFRKLLDGGREFKYYSQCCAGDTLVYQTRVNNITEKEGKRGKFDIVTSITTGKNKESNEKVFDQIHTWIVFH